MITMMADINKNSFGGAPVVSCYTCHQGHAKPVSMVALPAPKPPSVDNPPPAPALPSVDEVLGRYVKALGGEAALRRITTRVITAKRDMPTGPGGVIPVAADVTMYQKAPNLTLNVYKTEKFAIADGFDGTNAWAQNMAGAVATPPNPDALRVKRMAAFYEPLELKAHYSSMTVRGVETVNGRQAYVIVATPEGDTAERLYFDTQTGLLLRRGFHLQVASGPSPFQMDFENYRDAGGVKIPFLVRMTPASQRVEIPTSSTLRVLGVQTNLPIQDSRFARPQTSPPAPRVTQ
jgi:zinc protease